MSIEINQLRNNSVTNVPIRKKGEPKNLEQLIRVSRLAWSLDAAKSKPITAPAAPQVKKLDAKDIAAVEKERKRLTEFIKASKSQKEKLIKQWKEEDRINGLSS